MRSSFKCKEIMKIAVAGTGYVGLSMATLLAQHNEVVAVDINAEKVEMINRRVSPIQDEYIEPYLYVFEEVYNKEKPYFVGTCNTNLHEI